MPKKKSSSRAGPATRQHAPQTPEQRAHSLLLRLETDGVKPLSAAEELDRLQATLAREERLDEVRERVSDLCEAWAHGALRGERGDVWLTLVGGFRLPQHAPRAAELASDPALPPPLRARACRALAQLSRDAARTLLDVLRSRGDAHVRVAAAESLGTLGDRSLAQQLEPLLEEDLPRPVWQAVSEAIERLRFG
jgi:hypothetical protein